MGLRDRDGETAKSKAERQGHSTCVGCFREHLLALAAAGRPSAPHMLLAAEPLAAEPLATTEGAAAPAEETAASAQSKHVASLRTSPSAPRPPPLGPPISPTDLREDAHGDLRDANGDFAAWRSRAPSLDAPALPAGEVDGQLARHPECSREASVALLHTHIEIGKLQGIKLGP